jgi:hypothetical protein
MLTAALSAFSLFWPVTAEDAIKVDVEIVTHSLVPNANAM